MDLRLRTIDLDLISSLFRCYHLQKQLMSAEFLLPNRVSGNERLEGGWRGIQLVRRVQAHKKPLVSSGLTAICGFVTLWQSLACQLPPAHCKAKEMMGP